MPSIEKVKTGSTICLLRDHNLGMHLSKIKYIGTRDVPPRTSCRGKRVVCLELNEWACGGSATKDIVREC